MIPRLQRFYHAGDPECWLQMREPLFDAYVAMMSRLQAEEALSSISQVSAGSATMTAHGRAQYVSDLRRHLPRPKAIKPTLRQLAQAGILVTMPETKED